MARIPDYSNPQKYSKRQSFDGQPVEPGKVLVPFRKDLYDLQPGMYIQANFTTMRLGEFRYEIGFMPIREECFQSYMIDFWAELNEDMKMRREGRCIIGKNPDGSDKICPYTKRCTGCPNKGLLERRNTYRVEILSLDYEYEGKTFEMADENQPSLEDQVLDKLCPPPTEEELKVELLAHFDRTNPRFAQIIRLKLENKTYDEICFEIKLKTSRGYQEINNCHDAVCDYLKLRHCRKNRK